MSESLDDDSDLSEHCGSEDDENNDHPSVGWEEEEGRSVDGAQEPQLEGEVTLLAAMMVQHAYRAWRSLRLMRFERHMRELARCVVCHDECVRMIRCSNGHGVCVGCQLNTHDLRCPLCREYRSCDVDASFESMLRATHVTFRCQTCQRSVASTVCEHHRAWCCQHRFTCPHAMCTHTCLGADLAEHSLRLHSRHTHKVRPGGDGAHHVVAAFPPSHDLTVFVLGDSGIAVLVSLTQVRRMTMMGPSSTPSQHEVLVQLHLRAIYPSPDAPAIVCTVRQLRVHDCSIPNSWVEEHRHGLITPVVASRESLSETFYEGPIVKPRVALTESSETPFVQAGACPPDTSLSAHARRFGLRDVGLVGSSVTVPPKDAHTRVALLHMSFRCVDERVGNVWSLAV